MDGRGHGLGGGLAGEGDGVLHRPADNGEGEYEIRIRYYSGVTPKWRVKWGSRIYDIESVINPDEKNVMLDLMCVEVID